MVQPIPRTKPVFEAPKPRDAGASLLDTLVKSYFSAVKGALTLHSQALSIAQEALAEPSGPLADLMNVMPELARPAERLPFNIVCQGPQKFAWTEISMADIQSVRQASGGTVNDVILTVMAAAIRRYADLHGTRVKGRSVRIMIPVNVRGGGERWRAGQSHIVPSGDHAAGYSRSAKALRLRSRAHGVPEERACGRVCQASPAVCFRRFPLAIWAAIGPVASQLPLSLCNIICTNVPGPPIPLYLLGRKMLSWYPYVPIGGEMGVNCAILSYNGMAYFGFTCDVNAVPDPEHLEKFVDISFAELRASSAKVQAQAEQPEQPRPK